MGLKENTYNVLVVSAPGPFKNIIKEMLPESSFPKIVFTESISEAKREFAERSYDFVVINAPLGDDFGTRFAIDVSSSKESVVLLIVKNELHDEIFEKTAMSGVYTISKPTSKAAMMMAIEWMIATKERLRKFRKKTLSVEQKMEEIRLVNKAKWLLISNLSMTEADAHRYIEKMAMDRCVPKREIAEGVIKTYS